MKQKLTHLAFNLALMLGITPWFLFLFVKLAIAAYGFASQNKEEGDIIGMLMWYQGTFMLICMSLAAAGLIGFLIYETCTIVRTLWGKFEAWGEQQ